MRVFGENRERELKEFFLEVTGCKIEKNKGSDKKQKLLEDEG